MRGVELAALGEQARHDRGGRHGGDAAERDARLPREPERQRGRRGDKQSRRDLRTAEPEHHAPHRAQLAEAEFEADGKHQEHDAELGEALRLIPVRREA